ncbi:MAG TPA: ABC transporter substrate-binding protein [Candidatus Binatia bacterium]|jgi:NitT/TauT family transport system substrate-binding protein
MMSSPRLISALFAIIFLTHLLARPARAQEQLSVSYAALGGANSIWNIAKDAGFYKKHGLSVDVVYIGSTTLSAAAVLSGHIQVGMVAGVGVINSAASGADLVSVACFVNVLDYELVVQPSIKSAEGLKGKDIAISRFGSVTDVAARAFLSELKLRPGDDVTIRQVGGASERAAAFRKGVVAGFLSSTGSIHLLGTGFPHMVLIRTADLKNPPPFPWICAVTTKSYLAKARDNVKKIVMALIEATHFFKTRKEDTKKIVGKYFPTANAAYLEDNYTTTTRILEQVPYVTRPGMENLINEARKTNPAIKVTINDVVDDTIVRDLEKQGFIDALYGKK